MITPQQFKRRWQRTERDRLVIFSESSLADVRLPADARAFLVEVGLPVEAAPFPGFEPPKSDRLERVSTGYQSPGYGMPEHPYSRHSQEILPAWSGRLRLTFLGWVM